MARVAKSWHLLPHDSHRIERFARALASSPIVAQLLLNRGINTIEKARTFLKAPLTGLHEPEQVPGVPEAAKKIYEAIRTSRPICIYGDYDVDGVSGTVILYNLLRLLKAKVEYHVPHRIDDGYGLNRKALEEIAARQKALVVTVDCGIASIDEVVVARELGLEVIVTDHHEFKSSLPKADVLVHPRLPEANYPFGGLCGAGVAFKLAWAIAKLASGGEKVLPELREFLLDAIALAALGTVADVMPLVDENRLFVRHGLRRIKERPTAGVRALLDTANLSGKKKLTAMDIGYTLAPRINAAGRMGSALTAVEMLTERTYDKAMALALQLQEHNQKRQQIERQILQEARQLAERHNALDKPALVLSHGTWHPGLIGIVAGRMADLFARPALMIAMGQNDLAVGSGRSIPGFKLHEALESCSEYLLAHGGHSAAAGFKLRPTSVHLFREKFCEVVGEHFTEGLPKPLLTIDAEVPLSALTYRLVDAIGELEPYGAGNPEPLMLASNVKVVGEPKKVGQDRHLSMRFQQNGKAIKAIAFGMADRLDELMSEDGICCLVFTPTINEWQGMRNVEIVVKDFRPGSNAELV